MKPKMLASLFTAGSLLFASMANAQYGYGYGLYPAQQACGYPGGVASGAASDADAIADLQNTRRDLQKDKRDAERDVKDLETKKDKYTEAINESVQGRWADVVIDHIENGYNCNCQTQQPPPSYINVEPPVVPAAPPPPDVPAPPPRDGRTNTDLFEPGNSDRAPASDGRAPAQVVNDPNGPPAAGTNIQGNSFDQGWNGGFQGPGAGPEVGSLCGPNAALNSSRAWQYVCRNGGGVSKEVCSMPFFAQGGAHDKKSSCTEAIDKYRKVTRDADRARDKVKSLEDQIAAIGIQIGDLQKDARDDAKLEASCPTGDCVRPRRSADSSTSNLISTLAPLGVGILGGLAAEGLGYYANKQNNNLLAQQGWPTAADPVGSFGLPFVQAGIYGSVAAGQKNAFGCGQSMYGGMMPGMGMNPYGMMPGMGMMGGGMYNPGMGPWGMSGPWGMGGMMPGMGMGMMMPGMGMAMPGMGMGMAMPGMGYAMPGMGMGMGMMMPGGMGMAMPGMGYTMPGMGMGMGMMMPGGMGMAMPGMGMAMPGMGFGIGLSMPGMAMPGMGMGLAMPGMGYSMPGMGFSMPGMGMMMPSMGYAMSGLAGGYGMGMQYQQQMMAAETSQMAQLRAQQSLMSQYNALSYQMQQINAGASLGGTGFGLGTGLNLGTLGSSPYGLGGSPYGVGGSPYYGLATPGLNR